MDSNTVRCQLKLKQMLEKLVTCTNHTEIDAYLQKFQNKLSENPALLKLPIFTEWLVYAVSKWWTQSGRTPAPNIACFALILAGLLMKHEDNFLHLNKDDFIIKLINCLKTGDSAGIKLAYIKLYSAFLDHKSGIQWITCNNVWKNVFHLGLTDQRVSVRMGSQKFMSKLLEKTVDHDEYFCNEVVREVVLPLDGNLQRSLLELTAETAVKNAIKMLTNVLQHFLQTVFYSSDDFRVPFLFLKNLNSTKIISNLILLSQNQQFAFDVGKIMYFMGFCELNAKSASQTVNASDVRRGIQEIQKKFLLNISTKNFEDVQKFCNFSHFYWKLMASKFHLLEIGDKNKLLSFGNQFVFLQLTPHTSFILKYCVQADSVKRGNDDQHLATFVAEIFKISSQEVIRQLYFSRDYLRHAPHLHELCIVSLCNIKESCKYFSREGGLIAFQILFHTLKCVVMVLQDSPSKAFHHFKNKLYYISLILEVLSLFIEEFEITWRDNLESIDLMAITFDLLAMSFWSSAVVCQALKLVNISMAKYMTPSLALLVDSMDGSELAVLGPLLFDKLQSGDSDVKIAASEVVSSLSRISAKKFPSLEIAIIDSKLPTVMVGTLTSRQKSSIKVAAVKCLREMIQVERIWNNALANKELPRTMTELLLTETDWTIQEEAVRFFCTAYEHQRISKNLLSKVYLTMSHVSSSDSHWIVKLNILQFWDKVIQSYLQNAGMVDGCFPEVTFSKERRKIITFTDLEIKKCLLNVLDHLSAVGCLQVLVDAIKNSHSAQVATAAVKITQNLANLLETYDVFSDEVVVRKKSSCDGPDYDEIIEQKICFMNHEFQDRIAVSPQDFLQFVQQDLMDLLKERRDGLERIEGLEDLLNEMLEIFDFDGNKKRLYKLRKYRRP